MSFIRGPRITEAWCLSATCPPDRSIPGHWPLSPTFLTTHFIPRRCSFTHTPTHLSLLIPQSILTNFSSPFRVSHFFSCYHFFPLFLTLLLHPPFRSPFHTSESVGFWHLPAGAVTHEVIRGRISPSLFPPPPPPLLSTLPALSLSLSALSRGSHKKLVMFTPRSI